MSQIGMAKEIAALREEVAALRKEIALLRQQPARVEHIHYTAAPGSFPMPLPQPTIYPSPTTVPPWTITCGPTP